MSKYTIGIDLGGTTMTAGLVNENYEIVAKTTWATRLPRPAEDLEKALADLCRTVAKENKVDFADVNYVGIGTPGSVNFKTGFVGFNTNFGYYDWNLGPDMEKMLGCKVYVENDANAAAYGEYIAGGAKGYNDHVNAKLAFDAMAKGDETAKQVVDSWIEYVGVGIANVINTFEPEVICIGGGVSNQGEVLLVPVRAYAENETKNITTGKFPKICACTLHNDAGVIGAAALGNSI